MDLPKIPNYHILEPISSGGMASVYKAIDLRSGYLIAIKALFPNRAQDAFLLQKFKMEANLYLYLDHPNITRLVDFMEYDNRFFIAMEYVDGMPLDEYLGRVTGPLPDEKLIPIFLQILDTICYMHHQGILHLDIKPNNIMIKRDMSIKMLDMGISARLKDVKNNIKICGTPSFMSPEQIQRQPLGRYTDIFALGITLFNMITCHLPFTGTSHTEIYSKILHQDLPQLTQYYARANPAYQRIVEKATAKSAMYRYQTCEEFEMDIRQIANV